MAQCCANLEALRRENGFIGEDVDYDYSRICNADQTGLFYQKLPNRIYCDKKFRSDIKGVKQMRDKKPDHSHGVHICNGGHSFRTEMFQSMGAFEWGTPNSNQSPIKEMLGLIKTLRFGG